jgi:copper homeostasis protein
MILEICANSYQSAMNAQKAGAHRIELCTELSVGGITPSFGLLKKVMAALTIPVHVLIRPRRGNFTYSDSEFKIMKEDIRQYKDLGCAGIVSGVLHANNTIDIKRTKELIELSKPMSFTFHRAFDAVPKPKESLLKLINLGVDRLLTSGQKDKAEDGIELLIELQQIAQNKLIIIMPGSGINQINSSLFKKARFTEIHSSASREISENTHSYFGNTPQTVSDIDTIKNILDTIA